MKKKLLAIVAAMAMVVAMVPSMVFADATDVAQIGTKTYSSLQEAINQANNGDEIKIISNINVEINPNTDLANKYATLFNVEGKKITIDLNGKRIEGDASRVSGTGLVGMFSTENGGELVLNDTVGGAIVEVKANGGTVYGLLVNFDNTSKITINGGNYIADKVTDSLIYTGGSKDKDGEYLKGIIVNGGTFKLGNIGKGLGGNGSPWIFNAKGQNENHVFVNGGTFNADVNHQYWIFEVQPPKEKALRNNGDGTWTIVDAVAYVDEWNESGKWYDKEVGYATLKEAVDAANTRGKAEQAGKDSEKITLLKDAKISDTLHFMKDTNLELNGKKIIWEGNDDTPVVSFDNGVVISEFEPSKVGYTFKGWYTDAKYENAWNWDFESLNSQTRATANVTSLYAKWTEAPVPEKSPDTGDNSLPYTLAVAGLALAAMAAVVATRRRTN